MQKPVIKLTSQTKKCKKNSFNIPIIIRIIWYINNAGRVRSLYNLRDRTGRDGQGWV